MQRCTAGGPRRGPGPGQRQSGEGRQGGRRQGIWPEWGVPWHEEASGAPALPPHMWPEAPGRGRLRFQGAHLGAMISAHAVQSEGGWASAACSTGRRERGKEAGRQTDGRTDQQADMHGALTVRQSLAQLPVPRLPSSGVHPLLSARDGRVPRLHQGGQVSLDVQSHPACCPHIPSPSPTFCGLL